MESHHDHGAGKPATPPPAEATDHAAMGHGAMVAPSAGAAHQMGGDVTRPQLVAVTIVTVLALVAAILWSTSYANLTIGSHEVRGAVMPPGMIQTRDMPAEAMRDMAAVDPDQIASAAPAEARGDRLLEPRIEDGVKVFDLETSIVKWHILPGVEVAAYAFNGQVPGPRLRVTEGDRIRMNVTNRLPESTTVHWHGLILPNAMDGAAEITQEPIAPGATFSYEFTTQQWGTYFYHSHDHIDRQQTLGLYGALIIDPADPAVAAVTATDHEVAIQLQEWLEREGYTYPAMPMEGSLPNYFTINGKAYPATETVAMRVGETLLVRFIGSNASFIHPMHIHGGPFRVVAVDGNPLEASAQYLADTVNVGPGQRFDVVWQAREPGKWLVHCHISHHTTNNNVEMEGGGGLMLIVEVAA